MVHESNGQKDGGQRMTDEYDDRCYECTGYGDDYYYDEESGEWVSACDDCIYAEDDEE